MTAAELRHDHLSIIRALSGAEQSRADLGRTLGWARNTVSSRLDDLVTGGWIVESDDQLTGRGRPSTLFRLNEDSILVFVASFGKDQVTATITTIGGTSLARRVIPGYSLGGAGSDGPVDAAQLLDELVLEADVSRTLVRIAVVGVTGPVEDNRSMPMYADLTVDGADFERTLGVPVVVENDANLMALGLLSTLDAQSRSLVFVKVATGIGAGLVIDGRLHRGLRGLAGELGHIPVAHGDGIPCNCGNYGCVGEVASAPAIVDQLRRDGLDVQSLDDLQPLVAAGNQVAIATLRQAGRDIGEAL
ncbi:MAG: ROK family protein, partial [Solirubrobacteraceae bacterium]